VINIKITIVKRENVETGEVTIEDFNGDMRKEIPWPENENQYIEVVTDEVPPLLMIVPNALDAVTETIWNLFHGK
jgi:hypothetical protein